MLLNPKPITVVILLGNDYPRFLLKTLISVNDPADKLLFLKADRIRKHAYRRRMNEGKEGKIATALWGFVAFSSPLLTTAFFSMIFFFSLGE